MTSGCDFALPCGVGHVRTAFEAGSVELSREAGSLLPTAQIFENLVGRETKFVSDWMPSGVGPERTGESRCARFKLCQAEVRQFI
jgi:hypothetical protein